MEDPVEVVAAIEHEQWMAWSQEVARTEQISSDRLERWSKYWVPYQDLPEEVKEHDRVWARKVVEALWPAAPGMKEAGEYIERTFVTNDKP